MNADLDPRFHDLPADWQAAMIALKNIHGTLEPMSIQLVLGIANTAAQCHWNVDSEIYGIRPISLFCLNMTPTAGRKSTNFRELSGSIDEYEKERRRDLEMDRLRFSMQEKQYLKDIKQYEKDIDSGIGGTLPIPPRPEETYNYLLKKSTLNGFIDQLKSQSWISIMSSEGGDFFNGHSFQGAKMDVTKSSELTSALTDLWDGHRLGRSTGQDRTMLYDRRMNMMLLLQESTVRAVLNNSAYSEQGFLHRILITQCGDPEFREQTATTVDENNQFRQLIVPFNQRILAMLRRPVNENPERAFELRFRVMQQSAGARKIFRDYYNRIVPLASTEYRDWAGFVNRCHEQSLRIATTVADYLGETEISEQSARSGVALADFYIEQRTQLEIGVTDPRRDLKDAATKLSSWLQKHSGWYTRRELGQRIRWFGSLTTDYRDNIIEELKRLGDIEDRERPNVKQPTMEFRYPTSE